MLDDVRQTQIDSGNKVSSSLLKLIGELGTSRAVFVNALAALRQEG